MDPELDFLEWHDARLERIVRDLGNVRLEFSRVQVYRKLGPGLWEEEIGAAVLSLQRAQVVCQPPGDERTTRDSRWVMDCTHSEPMARDDVQSLGRGVGPGRIGFEMADCSTVEVRFEHAQLRLMGPLAKVGKYREPPLGPHGAGLE